MGNAFNKFMGFSIIFETILLIVSMKFFVLPFSKKLFDAKKAKTNSTENGAYDTESGSYSLPENNAPSINMDAIKNQSEMAVYQEGKVAGMVDCQQEGGQYRGYSYDNRYEDSKKLKYDEGYDFGYNDAGC